MKFSLKYLCFFFLIVASPIAVNADFVMDDFAGAAPPPETTVTVTPDSNLSITRNLGVGYEFAFTGTSPETATIKYDILGGLFQHLTDPDNSDDVYFTVQMWRTYDTFAQGTFTLNAYLYEDGSATRNASAFFTTTSIPENTPGDFVMNTSKIVSDLATSDITAVEFELVTFNNGTGLQQNFHFGNGASPSGGLEAIPEPTSVAMFGSAVVGLCFRRRRK